MRIHIEFARLAYGEQVMRCTNRPVEMVSDLLCMDGEYEKAHKWIALAIAKRQGDPDIIRGLLAYFFSNYTGKPNLQRRRYLIEQIENRRLHLKDCSYEMLAGTCLSWDHVFQLCGKSFNPTREKERVRKIFDELMAKKGEGSSWPSKTDLMS
ncbi:hypothetical protein HYR54_10815 [Candidatus Acetothermia bacterium]|nr:hypothetical protein [Candidatus Acetothermia bacterium]MBI3459347.1 hypothetical protein [Candidatus Acetothermia bacterium]MBI3660257.1 hypothetical protein [Candidatus Acetothermia bacterium]